MQYAVAIRRAWHRRCTFLCVMMPVKSAPRRRETSRQTKTVLEGLARLSPTRSCAPSCASTERLSLPRIPSLAISYFNACWCILLCLRLLKCLRVCVCVCVCGYDAVPLQCCRCRAAAVLQMPCRCSAAVLQCCSIPSNTSMRSSVYNSGKFRFLSFTLLDFFVLLM